MEYKRVFGKEIRIINKINSRITIINLIFKELIIITLIESLKVMTIIYKCRSIMMGRMLYNDVAHQ